MKFTASRDKVERAEIKVTIRLSRDEVNKIHQMTTQSIPEFLLECMTDSMFAAFEHYDSDYEDERRET